MADTVKIANSELVKISGWDAETIAHLVRLTMANGNSDPELHVPVDGNAANFAFLYLLIQNIDETAGATITVTLPQVLSLLQLNVPENVSSFVRSVRRCIIRAEKSMSMDILKTVPDCLITKPHCTITSPLLEAAGVTTDWLINSSDHLVTPIVLTYGMLLELGYIRKQRKCTYIDCAAWIQRILCLSLPPSGNSIERRLNYITTEKSKLRGKPSNQEVYLQTIYKPLSPQSVVPTHTFVSNSSASAETSIPSPGTTFPTLAHIAADVLHKTFQVTVSIEVPIIEQLDSQLNEKAKDIQILDSKLFETRKILSALKEKTGKYSPKNVYRRDLRHQQIKKQLCQITKEVETLKTSMTDLTKAKDNALKLTSKWKAKALKRKAGECSGCLNKSNKVAKMKTTVEELQWDQTRLNFENDDLKEQLKETNLGEKSDSTNIITKEGKQYNDRVRAVWMELLSLGVAVGKVSKVVKAVIEGMADMTADSLPSKGFTSQLQTESQIVSQYHMADIISKSENVTLHLDGTKKRFREYGSFQLSTSSECGPKGLCIGIEEMVSGEAKAYRDTILTLFNDIAETFVENKEDASKLAATLLASIKNTMTDRHIVNRKFKELFEEARKSIFSDSLENFNNLTDNQQQKITDLHSFYCGLHVLTNMGTVAAQSLKVFEEIALATGTKITQYSFNKGNARSFDLIFEISQALTRTGSQRSGCAANWDDFLAEANDKNYIESFLHHRFNVLFTDAAAIHYHRDQIVKFLSGYNLNENRMLLCIKDSLVSSVCQAAVLALGLIAMLITVPLWILLEKEKTTHILHLNPKWLHLQNSLRDLAVDATPLLQGCSVFPEIELKKNKAVYESLFSGSDTIKSLTKDCLEILCFDMEKLISRQLKDQLPGGLYYMPSESVLLESASCPTSNRIGERDFSDVDRDVSRAPQKATAHHSSSLTFRNNKTVIYLNKLPEYQRKKIFQRALALAPGRRLKNRERIKVIRKQRQKLMHEHKAQKEKRILNAALRKQQVSSRVGKLGGLWDSAAIMESTLQTIQKQADRIKAVKDQLSLHMIVNRSACKKDLVTFSCKGQQKPLDKLKENLLSIIQSVSSNVTACSTSAPAASPQTSGLRDSMERQRLIDSHKVPPKPIIPATQTERIVKSKQAKPNASVAAARKIVGVAKLVRKPPAINTDIMHSPTSSSTTVPSQSSFTFTHEMISKFIAIGFEDSWYIGEILEVLCSTEATVKYMSQVSSKIFQWPAKDDVKTTKSCFVVSDRLLSVSPRDSGLRFWELDDAQNHLKNISQLYSKLVRSMKW